MSDDEIRLSLRENSLAFLREAAQNAVEAEDGSPRRWQFAIVHVVQSLELAMKALLERQPPVFVYEDIDNPDGNTVRIATAMKRLADARIGGVTLSEAEQLKINTAIKERNKMTHSDFVLKPMAARAKFCEMFAFVVHFYKRHFDQSPLELMDSGLFEKVRRIDKAQQELRRRALEDIRREGHVVILICPACGEDTYVAVKQTCYVCHTNYGVITCDFCGHDCFEHDIVEVQSYLPEGTEIDELIEWAGRRGGDYACYECFPDVLDTIDEIAQDKLWELVMGEASSSQTPDDE